MACRGAWTSMGHVVESVLGTKECRQRTVICWHHCTLCYKPINNQLFQSLIRAEQSSEQHVHAAGMQAPLVMEPMASMHVCHVSLVSWDALGMAVAQSTHSLRLSVIQDAVYRYTPRTFSYRL